MTDFDKTLADARAGDRHATEALFQHVYDELRRIAAAKIANEPAGLTLQPTALVHEAYMRLIRADVQKDWSSSGHFIAVAADVMRHILIDNARRRKRIKRGGGEHHRAAIELDSISSDLGDERLLQLNDALDDLAKHDPVKARLVVLRYFGGMTIEQACEVLGISRTTASRSWTYARAWLFRRVGYETGG
jgi:RNA polymerase sigma factor (TIGR02999 family)